MKIGDKVLHISHGEEAGLVQHVWSDNSLDVKFSDGEYNLKQGDYKSLQKLGEDSTPSTASVVPKPPRTIWIDRRTGEQFSANQDFINRLPSVLGTGEENIQSVRTILETLGGSYADDPNGSRFANDSRQLRDAKQYLVNEKNIPIVAVQSQRGGYYIAKEPSGLLQNAAAFREQAAGLIRMAESLEALAINMNVVIS